MRRLWAIAAAAAATGAATTMPQSSRRLSRSDGVKWRGTLNSSAIVNKYLYVFVHIPKNAGASFMKDSPRHLPRGAILKGSHEKALWHGYTQHLIRSYPRKRLVLMPRHPMLMVDKQFLTCRRYVECRIRASAARYGREGS